MSYLIQNGLENQPKNPRWSSTESEFISENINALIRNGTGRTDVMWKTVTSILSENQLFRYGDGRNDIRYEDSILEIGNMTGFIGHKFRLEPYLTFNSLGAFCAPSPSNEPTLSSINAANRKITFDTDYRYTGGKTRYMRPGQYYQIEFAVSQKESDDTKIYDKIIEAQFKKYQYVYLESWVDLYFIKLKITGTTSSTYSHGYKVEIDPESNYSTSTSFEYMRFSNS